MSAHVLLGLVGASEKVRAQHLFINTITQPNKQTTREQQQKQRIQKYNNTRTTALRYFARAAAIICGVFRLGQACSRAVGLAIKRITSGTIPVNVLTRCWQF